MVYSISGVIYSIYADEIDVCKMVAILFKP